MTWSPGEQSIRAMLERRQLQQVPPNEQHAHQLLEQAQQSLAVAEFASSNGYLFNAVTEAWEAARKALTAPLTWQGLRPTTEGGHQVVIDAAKAQFGNVLGGVLRPAARLKRRRNDLEYPTVDAAVESEEVADLLDAARAIVAAVPHLLRPELSVFR